MPVSRLQDDLLQEFREEKRIVQSQIELLEPLAASLRRPAAVRLTDKGLILFGELLCWALALLSILICVFLDKLYPFYLLFQLSGAECTQRLGMQHIQMLRWGVYALLLTSGLLCFLLARTLARVRHKNGLLSSAGIRVRTVLDQHIKRRAAIEAMEQRHFSGPAEEIVVPEKVNEVRNPGYEDPLNR